MSAWASESNATMKLMEFGTDIAASSGVRSALSKEGVAANTEQCLRVAPQFNEFENSFFGRDFSCSYKNVEPWVDSGDLFYAAILRHGEISPESILSVASILVVDAASCDGVVAGQLRESELVPFSLSHSGTEPVLYYSSLILAESSHLLPLFRHLTRDIVAYCSRTGIAAQSAFTIPAGDEGLAHTTKCGFVNSGGPKYLGKYEVMLLTRMTARVQFWKDMVSRARPTIPENQDLEFSRPALTNQR